MIEIRIGIGISVDTIMDSTWFYVEGNRQVGLRRSRWHVCQARLYSCRCTGSMEIERTAYELRSLYRVVYMLDWSKMDHRSCKPLFDMARGIDYRNNASVHCLLPRVYFSWSNLSNLCSVLQTFPDVILRLVRGNSLSEIPLTLWSCHLDHKTHKVLLKSASRSRWNARRSRVKGSTSSPRHHFSERLVTFEFLHFLRKDAGKKEERCSWNSDDRRKGTWLPSFISFRFADRLSRVLENFACNEIIDCIYDRSKKLT